MTKSANCLKFGEKRFDPRFALKQQKGLSLQKVESNQDLKSANPFLVDVSGRGIGMIISMKLVKGEILQINIKGQSIPLRVQWCKSAFENLGIYRVGLEIAGEDQTVNLRELLETTMVFDTDLTPLN